MYSLFLHCNLWDFRDIHFCFHVRRHNSLDSGASCIGINFVEKNIHSVVAVLVIAPYLIFCVFIFRSVVDTVGCLPSFFCSPPSTELRRSILITHVWTSEYILCWCLVRSCPLNITVRWVTVCNSRFCKHFQLTMSISVLYFGTCTNSEYRQTSSSKTVHYLIFVQILMNLLSNYSMKCFQLK